MPIYLTLASLIIDKTAIEKKYKGGVSQFRSDYFAQQGEASQEDDEVFMIARMNWDDFDINELIEMGFHYNKVEKYSTDFVIYQRYSGYLWKVDWMGDNKFYAWHIHANEELKSKANRFIKVTMDEISKVWENNQEPFIPLTKENKNTHPIVLLLNTSKSQNNSE